MCRAPGARRSRAHALTPQVAASKQRERKYDLSERWHKASNAKLDSFAHQNASNDAEIGLALSQRERLEGAAREAEDTNAALSQREAALLEEREATSHEVAQMRSYIADVRRNKEKEALLESFARSTLGRPDPAARPLDSPMGRPARRLVERLERQVAPHSPRQAERRGASEEFLPPRPDPALRRLRPRPHLACPPPALRSLARKTRALRVELENTERVRLKAVEHEAQALDALTALHVEALQSPAGARRPTRASDDPFVRLYP